MKFEYIETPPRSKRLLFDQFHNLNYPTNGLIWRDTYDEDFGNDPYEWLGDHLFTNMIGLYNRLTKDGYYIEILNEPLTCFDARNYGALLMIDIEDYLSDEEISSLRYGFEQQGLTLIIVADWYNEEVLKQKKYYNIVTFEDWYPFMGGSNLLTLNQLLQPYHIALGQGVYQGKITLESTKIDVLSSTEIIRFPKDGYLVSVDLKV